MKIKVTTSINRLAFLPSRFMLAVLTIGAPAGAMAHGKKSSAALAEAANELIATLDQERKGKALFSFADKEQSSWHFFPDRMRKNNPRKGLPYMSMTNQQKELTKNLLQILLTSHAFNELEDIRIIHGLHGDWDAADNPRHRYYVSIFGKPSTNHSWGFSFEGHHLSLNCTLFDGRHFAVTPSFWGAGPVTVTKGPHKGIETFKNERYAAIKLVNTFSEEQSNQAMLEKRRGPGTSSKLNRNTYLPPSGIRYTDLDEEQQGFLLELVRAFAHKYRLDVIKQIEGRKKIEDTSTMTFAYVPGSDKYVRHFRIQTEEYLIEFDNPGDNHVHSAWRDFDGDFGRDLILEHLKKEH